MAPSLVDIKLLGAIQITSTDGHPLIPRSKKARAIVALLCLSPGGRCARSRIAATLWDRVPEAQARSSLRQALRELLTALGDCAADLIAIDREALVVNLRACRIDIQTLLRDECLPAGDDRSELSLLNPDYLLEDLTGISVAFDHWLVTEKMAYSLRLKDVLESKLKKATDAETTPQERLSIARQTLSFDPTHEGASRVAMRALLETGEIALALREFDRCRAALRSALDVEPSRETRTLYQVIRTSSICKDQLSETLADNARTLLSEKPSIAVLPFANLSGDPGQDYFADGMVEDIITALSRMRWLFVIARNSSFIYKKRPADVRDVGRELGVRYVLQGSVRSESGKVRLTGRLVDSTSGALIWADRFECTRDGLFALQDEVVTSVIGALSPRLEQAEIERAKRKPPNSLDAYDIFLRGMADWHHLSENGVDSALRLFAQSIEIDPGFSTPYGLSASCYLMRRANQWDADPAADAAETARLTRHILEFGRDDAIALSWAGHASAFVNGDLDTGRWLIDRGLTLNPNLAVAWQRSGWVRTYQGEPEIAIEHLSRALRLNPVDPLNFLAQTAMSFAQFMAGHHDEASAWAGLALQGHPNWSPALRIVAASCAHRGLIDEAKHATARLLKKSPALTISSLKRHHPLCRPADYARLADGLRLAGLPE